MCRQEVESDEVPEEPLRVVVGLALDDPPQPVRGVTYGPGEVRQGPRQGLRTSEDAARALRTADDDAILDAMAANPILIERPLVETDKGVRLGRPPEKVREIL